MQAVLTDTGSSKSRGRAQKILMLQQEVNELQTKLNVLTNRDEHNFTGIIIRFIYLIHFLQFKINSNYESKSFFVCTMSTFFLCIET